MINASAPIGGWNGTPDDDQINSELARSIYQTGLIANALQTQIISRLDDVSSWKSDRVVKNKINQIINEIVDSKDFEKILINSIRSASNGKYFLILLVVLNLCSSLSITNIRFLVLEMEFLCKKWRCMVWK